MAASSAAVTTAWLACCQSNVGELLASPQTSVLVRFLRAFTNLPAIYSTDKHLDEKDWFVGNSKVFLKTNLHRTVLERLKVTRVTVYAQRIQSACRAFVVRMKANRVKYAALKEKARLDAEKDKTSRAARVIQKHIRRKLVVIMMRSMHSLIELRKVLARKVSAYVCCGWG
jgi:myosin heavy subunit